MADGPRRIGRSALVALWIAFALLGWWVFDRSSRPLPPRAHRPFIGAIDVVDASSPLHRDWEVELPAERAADPRGLDRVYDPQRDRMRRSFRVLADGGLEAPFDALRLPVRIESHEGTLPVSPTAACELRVLPLREPPFDCLVRVMCAGEVLYPNPSQTAGLNRCVREGDRLTTIDDPVPAEVDGDPRIAVDLEAGTILVSTEGEPGQRFSARLRSLGDRAR